MADSIHVHYIYTCTCISKAGQRLGSGVTDIHVYVYTYTRIPKTSQKMCKCEFKSHAIIARKGKGEPGNKAMYSQGWSIGWLGAPADSIHGGREEPGNEARLGAPTDSIHGGREDMFTVREQVLYWSCEVNSYIGYKHT